MTKEEYRTLDEILTNLEIWSTWSQTFANEMVALGAKIRNLLINEAEQTEPSDWKDDMWKEACAEACKQTEIGCGKYVSVRS